MKKNPRILCGIAIMSMLPLVANAAGTYYNGSMYQNPQNRYTNNTTTTNGGGFYNNYGAGRGYGQNTQNAQAMQNMGTRKTTVQTVKKTTTKTSNDSKKQGFYLNADLTHEFASWNFDMKTAGSKLHYDNLRWNALDGELAYYFAGSTPVQVKVGGKYGMQFGDSPMIDDDITSGGMWIVYSDGSFEGTPAVSIGKSNGGKEYGFNAALGLTDFFGNDRIKFTPSIGYRYFKYQLETKDNAGAMVQVVDIDEVAVNCFNYNGEIQCGPYVGFFDGGGNFTGYANQWAQNPSTGLLPVPDGSSYFDLGSTYYYEQPGTSHKYETEWAGPYIALDMEYIIDNDNLVSAGLEFGLPTYKSTGNQPYRFDWAHPKSVEDEGGFGDAWHLGLNAMWSTSVSDSIMLSVGMTYDYYSVKGADATTYLNEAYYQDMLTYYEDLYINGGATTEDIEQMNYLQGLKSNGWSMKSTGEIESIYKSMGIRIGLNVKF